MLWWYLLLSGLYTCALLYLIYSWWRWVPSPYVAVSSLSVSVIIAFRNEEAHLHNLVNSLKKQAYEHWEVLFINDHSTDTSLAVLTDALSQVGFRYQVMSLKETSGKKAAIARGIQEATGEIVLTTDADCSFGQGWVGGVAAAFSSTDIQLVSAPVALTGKTLFQQWQQMEFSVLIATGAVGIVAKKPSMANGANLAYRKSVFESVGGFNGVDDIASGDDELLLMKVHRKFPEGIRFLKNLEVIVKTEALRKWSDFRNQRLRWAGKWKYGKRTGAIIGALAVFVFNLSLLLLPVFGLVEAMPWWQIGAILFGRLIIELMLTVSLAGFFQNKLSVKALLLHQILYPFYAVYFGLAANFGNYRWKGRSYRA